MSNIKREACRSIAKALSGGVPALRGKCEASRAEEDVVSVYPAVRVVPKHFMFTPFQDEEIDIDSDTSQLVRRGDFEGQVEIRLYEQFTEKREELEEQVLQFILGVEGPQGTLLCTTDPLTFGGVTTIYAATIIAWLDEEDWREELVFTKKRMSSLTLSLAYPAIVLQSVVLINELYLSIAQDLAATTPEETVRINEDGSLTKS